MIIAKRAAVICALALLALSPSTAFGPAARFQTRSRRVHRRSSALRMDLYDDLGVTRSADAAEIKSAFRKKARQYHPDVNSAPDAQEKVGPLNDAYQADNPSHLELC